MLNRTAVAGSGRGDLQFGPIMPPMFSALLATLLQIAVGLLFATVLTEWREQVTRSFLVFCGALALGVDLLALGLGGLVRLEGPERSLQLLLTAALVLYLLLLLGGRRPRLVIGWVGCGLGAAALVLAAANRPSAALGPVMTTVAFFFSAAALGSALGGLTLGHWYLTTPNLTSRPLRLLCDLLLVSLVPLGGLTVWYLQVGGGTGGFAGLEGWALWLGAAMVTLFPFSVTVAARVCCVDGPGRGRALQAATGLLYLVGACVLAGGLAGNAVLLGA